MIRLIILALLLASCASDPAPLQAGEKTEPLPGCIELRKRGGKC